jgi:ElaB/YqjD/DUF883 family membrane-anchored ribosome-binding protein
MGNDSTADQVNKIVGNVKENVTGALDKAGDLAGRAQNTSGDALKTIQAKATDAGAKISDLATTTYKQSVAAGGYLSEWTAEQPLLALLLAAAAGYAIASLVHRR